MNRKIFRRLITLEEALNIMVKAFNPKPLGVEMVPLQEAAGRVLAEDVYAPIAVPPFDRAAMDGYAVRAEDTYGAEEQKPVSLKVIGRIEAGEEASRAVGRGEALEIATGAPIPPGADAVIPVELTSQRGNLIEAYHPVRSGENIAYAGSDLAAGELALRRGSLLTPREIGVLASLGLKEAPCYRRPKVCVASTGRELLPPGETLPPGKIYDVNSYTVSAAVEEQACQPILLGVIPDEEEDLRRKLSEGLSLGDLLVISGGTSAGAGDLLYRVLGEMGEILFHGVSVKPGKPSLAAKVRGKPVLGLPGYPASALMVFHKLFSPILRGFAGLAPESPESFVEARVGEKIFSAQGRLDLIPVHLVNTGEGLTAFPVEGGSGAISTLSDAEGFLEVPESKTFLEPGENVKVKLFSVRLEAPDLVIAGSPSPEVEVLLKVFRQNYFRFKVKFVSTTLVGGLTALRRGLADAASLQAHPQSQLDLQKYGLKGGVAVFKGYLRRVGFLLPKGNPKNFKGLKDLLRGDLSFLNLRRGFGEREHLDLELGKLAQEMNLSLQDLTLKFKGLEASSPWIVVSSLLNGRVDIGLGVESLAKLHGLDFAPLTMERCDLAVRIDRLEKPAVQALLSVLSSEEFKIRLERLGGVEAPPGMGRRIL